MPTTLMQAKFSLPRGRPGLIPRGHLIERLSEGLRAGHKLTLLCAPAGYGKTTLLCEWVTSLEFEIRNSNFELQTQPAWLSLDEGDNDPARFLAYLAAALQGEQASTSASAPLQPFQTSEDTFAAIINQVGARPGTALLILDDYHLITAPAVHQAVAFLLEHMPPNLHLALSTRSDPPALPIARLRARGQLTELRQADLQFAPEEAAAFFERTMRLNLSPEQVHALTRRTEGWIAGLQLAAVALRTRLDKPHPQPGPPDSRDPAAPDQVAAFIQDFEGSHRFVLDYLLQEVLEQQPPERQDFMLRTSILEQMTAPLCAHVLGTVLHGRAAATKDVNVGARRRSEGSPVPKGTIDGTGEAETPHGSQRMLEQLEQDNLFIVALDEERRWYRYHHLFAHLLRRRLEQTRPGDVSLLHRRASDWYAREGLLAPAIEHALEAGAFETAAGLIEQAAEATLKRSEIVTFMHWLEALPEDLIRVHPSLCLYHGWGLLLTGHPLEAVQARLKVVEQSPAEMTAQAATLRAFIAAFQGQAPRAAELSQMALEQLAEEDAFLRSVVAWNLSIAHMWSGDFAEACQSLEQTVRMARAAGNLLIAVVALCHLGELRILEGKLHQAQALYEQALDLATDQTGQLLPIAGSALIGLGELLRERNELENAACHFTQGIELTMGWGEIAALDGHIGLARVKGAQGDWDGAEAAIDAAWKIARKFDATEVDDRMVAVHQARLWIAAGKLEAAARWARARGLAREDGSILLARPALPDHFALYYLDEIEAVTLARLCLAQGRLQEAQSILQQLLPTAEQEGRFGAAIEMLALLALAYQAQGWPRRAGTAMDRALALAEPEGYVQLFLDIGKELLPQLRPLLRQAAAQGTVPQYASSLLATFASAAPPPQALPEPLSQRELEILRLIAAGLSNQEIGDALVIAVSTVKWHINNIYGKLGVHSRTQALAQAQELDLL